MKRSKMLALTIMKLSEARKAKKKQAETAEMILKLFEQYMMPKPNRIVLENIFNLETGNVEEREITSMYRFCKWHDE